LNDLQTAGDQSDTVSPSVLDSRATRLTAASRPGEKENITLGFGRNRRQA